MSEAPTGPGGQTPPGGAPYPPSGGEQGYTIPGGAGYGSPAEAPQPSYAPGQSTDTQALSAQSGSEPPATAPPVPTQSGPAESAPTQALPVQPSPAGFPAPQVGFPPPAAGFAAPVAQAQPGNPTVSGYPAGAYQSPGPIPQYPGPVSAAPATAAMPVSGMPVSGMPGAVGQPYPGGPVSGPPVGQPMSAPPGSGVPYGAAMPAPGMPGGPGARTGDRKGRTVLVLAIVSALLFVLGGVMATLYVTKSSELDKTDRELTAQVAERDSKIAAEQQELERLKQDLQVANDKIKDLEQDLTGTENDRDEQERQKQVIAKCLNLFTKALTATSRSAFDKAIKEAQKPCNEASKYI